MNEVMVADLKATVSDRIKSTFVSLIPEDQWKALVDKEIGVFFAPKDSNGYGRERKTSPFQDIVAQELEARFRADVLTAISEGGYLSTYYVNNGLVPSDAVKLLTEKLAPVIVQNMFGGFVQNAVMAVERTLSQGGSRGY